MAPIPLASFPKRAQHIDAPFNQAADGLVRAATNNFIKTVEEEA
jgi:hypothetical protein